MLLEPFTMEYRHVYTSVGCNLTCQCVDWSESGCIVFGASYSCVILEKDKRDSFKVRGTFTEHKGKVNTVKWLKRENIADEFISGGDDNDAIVWRTGHPFKVTFLKGHTGSVTSVDSIYAADSLFLATASADSTVRVWKENENDYPIFQQISLGMRICLAICFASIQRSGCIILAFSTTDNKVQLYIKSSAQGKFELTYRLVGHSDWVRGLDFIKIGDSGLNFAVASQDCTIRIWRIASEEMSARSKGNRSLESFESDNVEHCCSKREHGLLVNLESIIQGHDDWVFDVQWHKKDGNYQLLSASMDKSLIVWQQNDDVWHETARLGVIGGNASGFYGGKFSGDGEYILGYGFMGCLYLWKKDNFGWKQHGTIEGHCAKVGDICWDVDGNYLISVSADKTSRVHAQVKDFWKVVARPQIHGYALKCAASIDSSTYVSGAEEKVIRVFRAPGGFLESYNRPESCNYLENSVREIHKSTTVQEVLGLSNKGVFLDSSKCSEANTYQLDEKLWPEIHKLYGHCQEISAIACSANGKYLASSAKAFNPEDSYISIWEVGTWKILQKIYVHQLTVTCIEFSRSSCYLLAVSRDRRWSLYETASKNYFKLMHLMEKTSAIHNRVIWCCDWSHDDAYFITSSRDGKLNVWSVLPSAQNVKRDAVAYLELENESITACAFGCQTYFQSNYLIAIGTGSGIIKLLKFTSTIFELSTIFEFRIHHLTINSLRFRPKSDTIQLASCSDDNFVIIYEFNPPKI